MDNLLGINILGVILLRLFSFLREKNAGDKSLNCENI